MKTTEKLTILLPMYAIYDSKAEKFSRPIFARSNGEMIRSFTDLANDAQHPIGQHPEDYTLFSTGDYDDNTGVVNNLKTQVSLGIAIQFKKAETIKPEIAPLGD